MSFTAYVIFMNETPIQACTDYEKALQDFRSYLTYAQLQLVPLLPFYHIDLVWRSKHLVDCQKRYVNAICARPNPLCTFQLKKVNLKIFSA